jgi:thiol:disulfide interchange protein
MRLDKDRFVVTYDASKANEDKIIATIKEAGYAAKLVADQPAARPASAPALKRADPPFFTDALALAKKERKSVVLDFYAEWCVPCKRMSRETFSDPKVKALLQRVILLKIDSDRFPDLAKKFGVIGLPDIRFLGSDGTEKKKLLDYQDAASFAKWLSELLDGSAGNR